MVFPICKLPRVYHQAGRYRVEGFNYFHPRRLSLDLLTQRVSVAHCQRWRHAARKMQRIGEIDQDLAIEIFIAYLVQGVTEPVPLVALMITSPCWATAA